MFQNLKFCLPENKSVLHCPDSAESAAIPETQLPPIFAHLAVASVEGPVKTNVSKSSLS